MDIFADKRNDIKRMIGQPVEAVYLGQKVKGTAVDFVEYESLFKVKVEFNNPVSHEDEVYHYGYFVYNKNDGSGNLSQVKTIPEEMVDHRSHIGDGVYLDFNEADESISIAVNHHLNHVVFLEREVAQSFVNYINSKFNR